MNQDQQKRIPMPPRGSPMDKFYEDMSRKLHLRQGQLFYLVLLKFYCESTGDVSPELQIFGLKELQPIQKTQETNEREETQETQKEDYLDESLKKAIDFFGGADYD